MSSIKLELNDFSNHNIVPIPEVGKKVIGIGLDGNLKSKDSNGIVTNIGTGSTGAKGVDGINGVNGVDGANTLRWSFGASNNGGQFGYSSGSWGNVNGNSTITINSFSLNNVNSYDWLNYLYLNGNIINSSVIKVSSVTDPNNFVVLTVQSIINNASNFAITCKVLGKGSVSGPISSQVYAISWSLIGKNGTSGTSSTSGTSGVSASLLNQNNKVKYLEISALDISEQPYPPTNTEVITYINSLSNINKTIDDISTWKVGILYDVIPDVDILQENRKSKYIAIYDFVNIGKGIIPTLVNTDIVLSYYEEVRLAHITSSFVRLNGGVSENIDGVKTFINGVIFRQSEETRINIDGGSIEYITNDNSSSVTISPQELSDHRTHLLPDKDGTYAFLDDISPLITKTKAEIDTLISTNSLVPGFLYEITGVHPSLYDDGTNSGTTIYLQAMTTNKLASQGNGIFYNPLYNKAIDGFGIWSNRGTWVSSQPISSILGDTGINPVGVTTDVDGNIYTANSNSNNVTKITPDGISTIFGTTDEHPQGITIDAAGNIYTANFNANNVSRITPSGVSTILGVTGDSPSGITIDSDGNIYTSNYNSNNVSKITQLGVSTILGTTGSSPSGIIIDADGNLYTSNNSSNNVSKITPDGTSIILGTTGSIPNGITIDVTGNIYTANLGSNNVSKITPDGTSIILGTTESAPNDITIDSDGNIYTSNYESNNVSKITQLGVSTILGTTGSSPSGIIIGADGNLYTSNINSNNVSKIITLFEFNINELITADNGATGQLFRTLDWNQFIAFTGDWSSATSITGDETGTTANVSDIVLQSYTIDGKAIWGGYSWTNTTGNVGSSIDVLNLDITDWSKDEYDEINYKKVLDLIEYDIENDWISRRYEVKSGNDVIFIHNDYVAIADDYSGIALFMYGNGYDDDLNRGIGNNVIYNSYNENINFTGSYQYKLQFNNNSFQRYMTFGLNCSQQNIIFQANSYQQDIVLCQDSRQHNITFVQESYQENLTFGQGSYQIALYFGIGATQNGLVFCKNSSQTNITFDIYSGQQNLSFGENAIQSDILFNSNSSQENIVFGSASRQVFLTFFQHSIQQNISIPQYLEMKNIVFEIGTLIDGINYSSATLVYQGFQKTIYKRPDGTNRLRYYNDADTLVFANVTD